VIKHFEQIDICVRNRYKSRLKNQQLIETSQHNPSSEREALTTRQPSS